MKRLIVMSLILFAATACEENITNLQSEGAIRGRIVYNDGTKNYFAVQTQIRIAGITPWIQVDDNLQYTLINIPPGVYDVEARNWSNSTKALASNVTVEEGQTTNVQDMIMLPEDLYDFRVMISDTAGDRYYFNLVNSELLVKSRAVHLRIWSTYPDANGYGEVTFRLTHNGTVYEKGTDRQIATFDLQLDEGINNIEVRNNESADPDYFESARVYHVKRVLRVSVELRWSTTDNVDAGDFDLYLYNTSTGDSVNLTENRPDWGIIGAEFDNPVIQRSTNPFGFSSDYERIDFQNAPGGIYQIKVHYYKNLGNPDVTIIPGVRLVVGSNVYTFDAPDFMAVGEWWDVASFLVE